MQPAVSVIIPCRNEVNYIEACLKNVFSQDFHDGNIEVIIVDGESNDGTREILERLQHSYPRLKVIVNPKKITPAALNIGIAASSADVIIRMDVHTSYAPNYISECFRILRKKNADNVGGPWIAKGNGYISQAIAAVFQSPFGTGGAKGHDPNFEGPVDTIYLGCWPKKTFSNFGYFDEELVRNQDDEHNLRILRSGGRLWQSPTIKSTYSPRNSLSGLSKQYSQYGYWKVRVIQKHKLPASIRHLIPALFVLSLFILTFVGLFSSFFMYLLIGEIGLYLGVIIFASFLTAAKSSWRLVPVLPVTFACYHLAYGWGFLRGIVDFIILGKRASSGFSTITRS